MSLYYTSLNKWKAQKSTKETDAHISQVYTRAGIKILAVIWSKDWTGDKQEMFMATIYHGEKKLAKIVRLRDHTSVLTSDIPKGYQVITSIKDDGVVNVILSNGDNSFFDAVVIKGRDTHLLEDLEYTKTALSMEGVVKPLLGAIKEATEKIHQKAK